MSVISSLSTQVPQQFTPLPAAPVRKVDSDGDFDKSPAGEVSDKPSAGTVNLLA